MQPWLSNVEITEFTENIPRQRSTMGAAPECGALPAQAFWGRYPFGCLRADGHTGVHSPDSRHAHRLDERDRHVARP